jgi:hypothetical protein
MKFSRRSGSVVARVDEVEAALLTALAGDLLELLGPAEPVGTDPLAALVGIADRPLDLPEDPALARLLPDAYPDDDAASADFRRYTEGDLRAGKRERAEVVLASLAPYPRGGRVPLDAALVDAWLGVLNDLRLVLGTRLEVTEETDFDPDADSDDPAEQALHVYAWLGAVQESLLACVVRR